MITSATCGCSKTIGNANILPPNKDWFDQSTKVQIFFNQGAIKDSNCFMGIVLSFVMWLRMLNDSDWLACWSWTCLACLLAWWYVSFRFHSSDQAAFNRKYGKPALFPRPKYWLPFTWKIKQIYFNTANWWLRWITRNINRQWSANGLAGVWTIRRGIRWIPRGSRWFKTWRRAEIFGIQPIISLISQVPQPTCFQVRRGPCLG